jgi:hypothetical protein
MLFRLFDGTEHRCITCGIPVYPDAEIHLLIARILPVFSDQLEDGVGRFALQRFKQKNSPRW